MKLKIDSIDEKKLTNGNPFWIVRSGEKGFFCFDKKITNFKAGDEIDVEVKEKEGMDYAGNVVKRLYIEFPKEKPVKNSGVANLNAMLLSFAKDLEIALLEKAKEPKSTKECLDEIQFIYEVFKNLIGGGE
jgi:hypothetical protein